MDDYERGISESLRALGARVRQLRLLRNLTQAEVATNAGVGLKALRQLESNGRGATETALRVAIALGVHEAFDDLFETPRFNTLAEAEAQQAVSTRRRARKRR